EHHSPGPDLGEERGRVDAAGDLLGPAVQCVGDTVLAAQRAVLVRRDGKIVLVLAGGDARPDLLGVRVQDHLVPAVALRGVGAPGGIGGADVVRGGGGIGAAVRGPVPVLTTLARQGGPGGMTGGDVLLRTLRPLLPTQETPHGHPRYRRGDPCPRRRAVPGRPGLLTSEGRRG